MKRVVSMVLAVAILVGMLPTTAWATEMETVGGTCGENLSWTFDESSGSLKISGTGDMDDYSWSQMYDPTNESSDIWVTDAPWRDYYNAIKSIDIESDVTSVGDGAFRGCSAVTSISLSNDVEALGEYSFVDCDGIIDIVIPENVKTIGEAAFSDCNALESVSILGAASIGNFAFSECANLISVELPETLTSIGEYGFRGCEALRTVTIPSSVRTIGTFAFVWCESLNEICFEGSAPSMDGTILSGLTCNVSYPSDDETWSEELQKEFDDTITWNGNSSGGEASGSSHSHSYGDWYETKAPTHEAEGEERRDCTGCNYYETRILEKLPDSGDIHEHHYTSTITEPTCTEQGFTTYICDCNDSYVDNYVDAIDHAYNDGAITTEPGCETTGIKTFTCANDPDHYYTEVVTAVGHSYGAWYETKAPTQEEEGEEQRDCSNCDHFETRTKEKISHNHTYEPKVTAPTCTEQGYTTYTCICRDSYVDDYVDAIGHAYDDGEITTKPGCEIEGIKTFTCANDPEHYYTEVVAAVGHSYGTWYETKAPTEEAEGEEQRDCENCDYVEIRKLEIKEPAVSSFLSIQVDKEDGYCRVTRCDPHATGVIVVPDSVDGYPVTHIFSQAFSGCDKIESVILPDCMEEIQYNAFSNCSSLTSIELGKGIRRIEDNAFLNCTKLKKLTVYDRLFGFDSSAVIGCEQLESIEVIGDNKTYFSQGGVLFRKYNARIILHVYPHGKEGMYIVPSNVDSIGEYAFYGSKKLTSITMHSDISGIGDSSFAGCVNLTEISLPNKITRIGYHTFSGCTGLKEIYIPSSITHIYSGAFMNCSNLEVLSIASGLTTIWENAFVGCPKINKIEVSKDNNYLCAVDNVLFNKDKTELLMCARNKNGTYIIPSGVKGVAENAFVDCSDITALMIPISLEYFNLDVFNENNHLTDIYYEGDKSDRELINISDPVILNATWHYNSYDDDYEDVCLAVRYFRKWDDNTAYWGEEPPIVEGLDLGSQVTEETDTSFIADVDNLVGTYVLVETKPRADGMIGPDILLSIKPVDTKIGTVTSADENTIVIDGETYNTPDDLMFPDSYVGKTVRYYLYNGELISLEVSQSNDKAYDVVLNEYRDICSMTRDEYDSQYKENDYPYVNQLMMRYYHIYGGMQIVYTFYDIDGNGVDELLIGNGNENKASIIGLYAFDGEKAVTLNNTAGERQSVKVHTDGTIKIQNSESASSTSTKHYRLDASGYKLTEVSAGSLTEIQNFEWSLLDISENTDKTTVAVRYYSVWDKGNETARFGLNDQYGSKVVTDETDFSFQINPTALLGQYVLVETKPRTDGQKGPDTLISMRAVETKTGIVSAANTESITIGGEIYATPADLGSPEGYVDQVVVYHLYDGKMVGIEILEKKEGILTYWNKEANAINIKLNADDEDVILYHLSSLTDENTRSWLDSTGVRNTRVQYLVDTNNILYQVKGIGFSPRYDGWSFVNAKEGFNYSLLKTRISEDRYQDVFGASYVASANASSDEVFKSMMPEWTGNCSGMSTTAVLFYMSMLDWSSFVGNEYETINSYYTDLNRDWMTNLLNPPTYTSSEEGSLITNLIENYQVLNCSSRDYSTIESTIDEVKSSEFMIATSENMLSHNANGGYIQTLMDYINTSSVPLIIILQYNGGAHAVVTRTDKIPERAENGWYRVYIYDPNHPYFPDNIFDQYQEYLRPYYSNTKDTYIELLPEENKWRWNGSDNGSTASKYRGTNADGEVIYMSAKTSDGSDISCPEWLYAYSIQNAGIPLHFDGSEPWLSTYGNKTGFVYSPGGYVDIYLPDGTLVCSVANGFPATYVDGIEFVPFVSADSTSGVCGKLIIPYTEFLVEYEDCEDISFIGFDNVINVSSSGKATIYISINDGEMHIVSKENSDILAQINNVYSNSEYTSVVADGEVCGGDAVTLRLNNDNFESDYSGDGALKVYTDNEDVLDRKYIMTLEEADGDVVIQNIRNGLPDEEVHIQHTAGNTWFSDGKSHWHQCTGCDEKLDLTVHAGGTASCTKKAICTVCGTSYGKLADHDYETSWSQGDADGHWHECKNCSAHDTQVKHTPGAAATEDTAQFCTVCGYVITPALGHTCTAGNKWYSNGTYHWHLCTSCGAWVKTSYHSYSSDTDETCNVCSYVRTVATTDPTEETAVATTETTEATVPSEEVIVTETAPTTVPTEANENLSDDAVSEDTDSHGVSGLLITVFTIVALGSLATLAILLIYKKRHESK